MCLCKVVIQEIILVTSSDEAPAKRIFWRENFASSSLNDPTNQGKTHSINFKGIRHKL